MDVNDSEIDKLSKRATNDTIEATISNLSSPRQSERSSLSIQPEWYQPSETRIDISLSSLPTPETIDACTFSPDGNHLATYSGAEGKITIWSVDELQQGHQLQPSWVSTKNTTLIPRQYLKKTKSFAPIALPMTELEKEHATDSMKKTEKIIGRHHFLEQGFTKVIACNGDRLYESGPGYERDPGLQNDHPIVELRIEPWNIYNPVKSAFILDDKSERVLFIGKQTIQLWTFGSGAKRLQYVWCKPLKDIEGKVPVTVYATIKEAILKRAQGDRFVLQVTYAISGKDKRSFSKFGIQPTNEFSLRERIQRVKKRPRNLEAISDNESREEELLLPSEEEFATFNIITHASYVLGFLDHIERKYWIQIGSGNSRHHFEELLQKCSNIVYEAIQSHTHLFNQIVKGQSPLEVLIRSDCKHTDKMIKALLKTNKHIPRFHDSGRTKSALSRAISLGKTEVVHSLLNYYCRRASENPVSWTITVVPAYNKLRLMYPDFALEVMEKLSYLPSTKNIERSNREENFAFSKVEELTREADDTFWQKFKTFYYKSERRIDHQIEKANDLIRIPHKTHPARECVVPLPGFTVYRPPPKKTAKELSRSRFPLLLKLADGFRWRKFRSPFVETALSGRYDIFGEPAMEAVINFKWRKFARMRIFFFIFMYVLYVAAYATAITLNDPTDPNYVLAHATKIRVLLYFVLAFGTLNLLLELTKIYGQWEHYWSSAYNYINLASTILPLLYTGKLLGDLFIYRPPYVGASLFFVYVNLILQFRVFKSFGISVFIIFQIFRRVIWFIVIIGIMVLAYAHMFLLLFKYPDVVNVLVANSTAPETFDTYPMSLATVYFFVTGSFNSANDAFSDPTIAILTIVFSFTTAIVLLNILIALMSDVIEVTKTNGKRAWLQQKAEVIAAVEMYMLSPSQRRRKDFFPSLIYYHASPDQVKAYKKRRQELKTTHDEIYHTDKDDVDEFVGFDAFHVPSDYDESINEINHSTKPSIWSSKKSLPSDAGSIVS
ncbi:10140_t:CDS:2 [Paraglomus occultum]|uniref:10140_t:CDS:1 n=1 Tax=Paraglomus occultum TaxID=144539 RepID=A0A9N9AIG0_9GLOM|nr:10140_t:CDS:2 [Paraglomus occultum]